jgi:ribosomal protein S7
MNLLNRLITLIISMGKKFNLSQWILETAILIILETLLAVKIIMDKF